MSLACLQNVGIGSFPEPAQSNSHLPSLLLQDYFNVMLLSTWPSDVPDSSLGWDIWDPLWLFSLSEQKKEHVSCAVWQCCMVTKMAEELGLAVTLLIWPWDVEDSILGRGIWSLGVFRFVWTKKWYISRAVWQCCTEANMVEELSSAVTLLIWDTSDSSLGQVT
jgi:hypothetical protein